MTLGGLLAVVFAAGAVGGVANALLTENGFVLPRWSDVSGVRVLRPGFLLNVFVGGLAGAVSWGLYGPFAAAFVVGGGAEAGGGFGAGGGAGVMGTAPGITLGGLVGAVLVGVAGARWLTNESEKRALRAVGFTPNVEIRNANWRIGGTVDEQNESPAPTGGGSYIPSS